MHGFLEQIAYARPAAAEAAARTWIYLPYDRLTAATGPLAEIDPQAAVLVLVESEEKGKRRPYHKKKIALLLACERHFALEQAARGVKIAYVTETGTHGDGLLRVQEEFGFKSITAMHPAERELRLDLNEAVARGLRLKLVADTTWLSTNEDFDTVYKLGKGPLPKHFVMDRFYRAMRKKTGLLMENSEPFGEHFSFDTENRKPYKGQVKVPERPSYKPDAVTQEVLDLVAREYPDTFGSLDNFDWPVTEKEIQHFWKFALTKLLPEFGPYEDAMSSDQPNLFHSKISGLMNLSRILPAQVIKDVTKAYAQGKLSLASTEGFIRQILGWREFMRHVHRVTDGYRNLDVFYEKKLDNKEGGTGLYAGAAPSALQATLPLPAAYWGVKSGLNCLDTVVAQVVAEGWSHHITRLMVLSNLATLCGFSPRELTDWFWFAYVDAYDWVVEANVLGMSTYGDGGVTATKPYVSGAAYIHRMSNYCEGCQFNPKKALGDDSCPFTALYWTFLERNADTLRTNIRLAMPYRTLEKKSAAEMKQLRERAQGAVDALQSVPRPEY